MIEKFIKYGRYPALALGVLLLFWFVYMAFVVGCVVFFGLEACGV